MVPFIVALHDGFKRLFNTEIHQAASLNSAQSSLALSPVLLSRHFRNYVAKKDANRIPEEKQVRRSKI